MIRNSRRVVALAIAGAVAIAPVISGCGAGSEPQTAAPTQLTEGVNASVPKGAATSQVDIRNMFLLGPEPSRMFQPGSSVPLYGTIINQVKGRQDRLVSVSSPDFAQVRIAGGALTLPPAQPSGEGTPVQLLGKGGAGAQPTGTASPKPTGTPTGQASGRPSGEPSGTATPRPTGSGPAGAEPSGTASPQPGAETSPTAAPTSTGSATPTPATESPAAPGGQTPLIVLTGLNRQLLGGETLKVSLRFEQAGGIELSIPVVPRQGEYTALPAVSPGVPAPGFPSPSAPASEGGHGGGTHATPGTGASPSAEPSSQPTTGATGGATPATPSSEAPATDGGHG
ncbi:hypothetical protein GCM10023085_58340 [Actinomadura viridis]|uniref:Copper(I)-binding protein n=1 Tax=Actinomadura viridis TaxID=58110 RepID=A0A931DRD8_9ACTN|nr:hypothetical protein [Actinomadura viridis]MBG6093373.1 copper(I)-binding protein [Actinomadura viridis]